MRSFILLAAYITLSFGAPQYKLLAAPQFGAQNLRYPTYKRSLALPVSARNINEADGFIGQIKRMTKTVKSRLEQLSTDPAAVSYINKVINDKDNICLSSLQEGIATIDSVTKLVENAGPDMNNLINNVKTLRSLKEPPQVIREVGNTLRILGPLITKISPRDPFSCKASPAQAFGSLRSLTSLLDELSYTTISMSRTERQLMKESSQITAALTVFLSNIKDDFARLKKICATEKQYNAEVFNAIGDMMVNLADMFAVIGRSKTGEEIREGRAFVQKVVVELSKIDQKLGFGDLNCNQVGDWNIAATNMDEIATLIEEVGLENLQQQLGVNSIFL